MLTISSITNIDHTDNQIIVDGIITPTGNYGGASTHGDTLNFGGFDQIKSTQVPLFVDVYEAPAAGVSATGYTFNYSPGTTLANGVVQVFGAGASAGAAGQEYTQASAYSAPLLAAALRFRAYFPSL